MSETQNATVIETAPATARKAGRPPIFTGDLADRIVALVKERGALPTRRLLTARTAKSKGVSAAERRLGEARKALGFPEPVSVSLPTILKLAKRNGLTLVPGRRKAPVTAEVQAEAQVAPVAAEPTVQA